MCLRPRLALALPCAGLWSELGWRPSPGAMHGTHCHLFLWKVLCPGLVLSISVGIIILHVGLGTGCTHERCSACKGWGCSSLQSWILPEVSLVPPHSLPGHGPGSLNSIYLSGCHGSHITDQASTTCVAFCLLRKGRETKTETNIQIYWRSRMWACLQSMCLPQSQAGQLC